LVIGRYSREIYLDKGNKHSYVRHANFNIEPLGQGKGFGTAILHHWETKYKEIGINRIETSATMIGKYAWLRMGFRPSEEITQGLINSAKRTWMSAYPNASFPEPSNIWELIAITGPDGVRIGKNTTLGHHGYKVTKTLDDNDPGYQAGQLYYQLKGLTD
jgi:hypothetical protein